MNGQGVVAKHKELKVYLPEAEDSGSAFIAQSPC